MLDKLLHVKRKRILVVVPVFIIGAIMGVFVNLVVNDTPAPKSAHAAATPTPSRTPTPTPKPTVTPTPTPATIPAFSITGNIFIDVNGNGKLNDLDSNYTPGATVSALLSGVAVASDVSSNTGKFTITGLLPNSYLLKFVVPDGYRLTTENDISIVITNQNSKGTRFGIIPDLWNVPGNEKFIMCKDLRQFVNDHC